MFPEAPTQNFGLFYVTTPNIRLLDMTGLTVTVLALNEGIPIMYDTVISQKMRTSKDQSSLCFTILKKRSRSVFVVEVVTQHIAVQVQCKLQVHYLLRAAIT